MKNKYIEQTFLYDGSQLKSLFAYMRFGLQGDSIVAWQGACDIPFAHMIDGEDLLAQSPIRGGHMLHFIVEKFAITLENAVVLQRLLSAMAADLVRSMSPEKNLSDLLRREGDDLYVGERKLSISIATVSPVSAMIHFAVNVTNENTPVATLSLNDLQIAPATFAQRLMEQFCAEIESIEAATCKVRPTVSL